MCCHHRLFVFETESHFVAQAALELEWNSLCSLDNLWILLALVPPPYPQCWDYTKPAQLHSFTWSS